MLHRRKYCTTAFIALLLLCASSVNVILAQQGNSSLFYVNSPPAAAPKQNTEPAVAPRNENTQAQPSLAKAKPSAKTQDNLLVAAKIQPVVAGDPIESKTIVKKNTDTIDPVDPRKNSIADGQTPSPLRSLIALAAVVMIIIIAFWLWKKFLPGAAKNKSATSLKIIARNPIGPKQSLCLVKIGSRLIVIGVSPNHIAPVDAIDDPDEIALILGQVAQDSPNSVSGAFAQLFTRNTDEYDDLDSDEQGWNQQNKNSKWNTAKAEVTSLLSKVKGLSRIHMKSDSNIG